MLSWFKHDEHLQLITTGKDVSQPNLDDHTLKTLGDKYTEGQTTRPQEKDTIIDTIVLPTKASQFMQEVNAGNIYRPEGEDPSIEDFNISMMATMEDIESSEVQDSGRFTNHSTSHGHVSIAGSTELRQNLEEPKAIPPFSHKPHEELKGRAEKPREKRITHGDLAAPINKLELSEI